MRIYKYNLQMIDRQMLQLPKGTQLLSVGAQGDLVEYLRLWALIDENAPCDETIALRIIGTGNPIGESENLRFIGTAQMRNGFVWHVFESLPEN